MQANDVYAILLACLLRRADGELFIDNKEVLDLNEETRCIGFFPDEENDGIAMRFVDPERIEASD